jgi:hypothetical protein
MPDKEIKQEQLNLTELAPRTKEDYEFLDKEDEDQILAEMRGDILSDYVYIICRKHKGAGEGVTCDCPIKNKIVSLSYAGVKRLIHLRGKIHLELIQFVEKESEFQAIFKAIDLERDITVYGGAQQAKKSERFGSSAGVSVVTDQFAVAKVISKASRNAWRNLIPETQILAMIKERLETEGVRLVADRLESSAKTGDSEN